MLALSPLPATDAKAGALAYQVARRPELRAVRLPAALLPAQDRNNPTTTSSISKQEHHPAIVPPARRAFHPPAVVASCRRSETTTPCLRPPIAALVRRSVRQ